MLDSPHEMYPSSLPMEDYGLILEIPDFFTSKELHSVQQKIQDYGQIDKKAHPYITLDLDVPACEKSKWVSDNCQEIFDYFEDTFPTDYRFSRYNTRSDGYGSYERLQGNPMNMSGYPAHNDGGKCITILCPLSPDESLPTGFHGLDQMHPVRSVPWKINHAILFCPSNNYSWHSYIGSDKDRWIFHYNLFDRLVNIAPSK